VFAKELRGGIEARKRMEQRPLSSQSDRFVVGALKVEVLS
jgi:hypothetical protein